ncbi:hypothetical protein BDN70DRAFT_885569 [Pholiota conissans]|uniref:Uncharacterized protein n=1 Tax=Pholiota conissans TaxID=109636 RepID=A0A9P5YRD1_9AGAR|nr:hypothetical protein BDN70DRAFT_885569 [Pholiota conissans]
MRRVHVARDWEGQRPLCRICHIFRWSINYTVPIDDFTTNQVTQAACLLK